MWTFFSFGGMTLASFSPLRLGSSLTASSMMLSADLISSSVMTSGGANRMMFWCVGFAYNIVSKVYNGGETSTYKQTLLLHEHAQIPSTVAIGLGLVNDNGVQETLATNQRDHWISLLNVTETLAEDMTKALSTLR